MSYLNLLQICFPFQVLSSFGVVECHEMTNHIWHWKSEPISTILVDLFCSRIMTNILTWMDTLRINVAECLVSKSDLPFPSVGRKWDVELEQQSDTWERVVTLSTAVRRKVALVFPLNSAVTCQAFLSVNFFFFAGIILWACFHLWYGWRIIFFFFIGNWVVRAGICNFQILSGIQFFKQLGGIKEASEWLVVCRCFSVISSMAKEKQKQSVMDLGVRNFELQHSAFLGPTVKLAETWCVPREWPPWLLLWPTLLTLKGRTTFSL